MEPQINKNNLYKQILDLIDVANTLLKYHNERLNYDTNLVKLFLTLVHLECVVDSYRVLIPPGSSFEFPEDKRKVELELSQLRKSIGIIRDKIGQETAEKELSIEGDNFKRYYLS